MKKIFLYTIVMSVSLLGYDFNEHQGGSSSSPGDLSGYPKRIEVNAANVLQDGNITENKNNIIKSMVIDGDKLSLIKNNDSNFTVTIPTTDVNLSEYSKTLDITKRIKDVNDTIINDITFTNSKLVFKRKDDTNTTIVIPTNDLNLSEYAKTTRVDDINITVQEINTSLSLHKVEANLTNLVQDGNISRNRDEIIKSVVLDGNIISLIKNDDSNLTVTLPSSVKLLDIQKDKNHADYDKYGTASYKLLDSTYTRVEDSKLHNIRSTMTNSERTDGNFTYSNNMLNISKRIFYTLPSGTSWSIDAITDLSVPNNSVVYFYTNRVEQLNQQTKVIPQNSLKVINADNFIPNESVMPVGVAQGGAFRLVSGQTTTDFVQPTVKLEDAWQNPNVEGYTTFGTLSYDKLDKHVRRNTFYDYLVVATSFTSNFPSGVPKNDKALSVDAQGVQNIYRSNGDGSFTIIDKSLFSDGAKLLVKDTNKNYSFDKPNGVFTEIEEPIVSTELMAKAMDKVGFKPLNESEQDALYQANKSAGTTYYVSNVGNDANDGLTEATAWKTLHKSDGAPAGSNILFKRGDTFIRDYGDRYIDICKADSVMSAYGTGEMPIITGRVVQTGAWTDNGDGTWSLTDANGDAIIREIYRLWANGDEFYRSYGAEILDENYPWHYSTEGNKHIQFKTAIDPNTMTIEFSHIPTAAMIRVNNVKIINLEIRGGNTSILSENSTGNKFLNIKAGRDSRQGIIFSKSSNCVVENAEVISGMVFTDENGEPSFPMDNRINTSRGTQEGINVFTGDNNRIANVTLNGWCHGAVGASEGYGLTANNNIFENLLVRSTVLYGDQASLGAILDTDTAIGNILRNSIFINLRKPHQINGTDTQVYNNIFKGTRQSPYPAKDNASTGSGISIQPLGISAQVDNTQIFNNTFIDIEQQGVLVGAYQGGTRKVSNTKVFNNIFDNVATGTRWYHNSQIVILENGSVIENLSFKNNIFSNPNATYAHRDGSGTHVKTLAVFEQGSAGLWTASNNIEGNPLMALPDSYRVKLTSPALNAGIQSVTTDIVGDSRSATPTIGAMEKLFSATTAPVKTEAFVRESHANRSNAVVEFTADRDMYVLVTWNGTGWRSSAQWGWLDTKYSGATLKRGHKGKCLLFLAQNIHQTLLPDNGYFFVKKGDTAKFWLEKASNINLDDNDRSNIIVRETAR